MPVWQKYLDGLGEGAPAFLSVAVDVQGPELPLRYVKEHGVRYAVAVDRSNVIAGSLLGQRVIPLWTLLDETGALVASKASGPSRRALREIGSLLTTAPAKADRRIDRAPGIEDLEKRLAAKPDDLAALIGAATHWANTGRIDRGMKLVATAESHHADAKLCQMLRAELFLRKKQRKEALAALRKGLALDPKDYLIRKQIWCVEHPEKFYEGKVDYGWQRQMMREGK